MLAKKSGDEGIQFFFSGFFDAVDFWVENLLQEQFSNGALDSRTNSAMVKKEYSLLQEQFSNSVSWVEKYSVCSRFQWCSRKRHSNVGYKNKFSHGALDLKFWVPISMVQFFF
jgi:hypothetical protein